MKRRLRALARAALPESGIAGPDHVLIRRVGGNDIVFAELGAHLDSALNRPARKLAQCTAVLPHRGALACRPCTALSPFLSAVPRQPTTTAALDRKRDIR